MSFQRVILNPLRRFTRGDQTAHDGIPPTWDRDDLPKLPDGQDWFEIHDAPEYDAASQRVEQVLDPVAKTDGWRVVDLTPEEIEAREEERLAMMPGVTPLQIIERLVEAGKWEAFEVALGQVPSFVEKAFYAAQEIKRDHHLFVSYGEQFRIALGMTEEEFDTLLTP